MKLLDRYIGRAVLGSTVVVLFILLALFLFATFAGELLRVGRGSYGLIEAAQYSLLLMPRLVYQLFPIVALLGTVIGLGLLASHSELVVIRAAGVSLWRVVGAVMKVGVLLMALMVIFGEFVAPAAELKAQALRAKALEQQVSLYAESGLWARDGDSVIHIRDLFSADRVGRVSIFTFDKENHLRQITQAKSATYQQGHWLLQQAVRSEISESGVRRVASETVVWRSLLDPQLLEVVTVKPEYLSVLGLYEYIAYLKSNGLDSGQYVMAFWKKLVAPIATAIMIFLAVPFVFGPLRSVGIGPRTFVGVLLGIGFFLLDQLLGHVGLAFGLNPLLSVMVAPLLFFILALNLVRRVR